MRAIAEIAYIVRHRHSNMTFDQVTLELDAEKYEPFKSGVPGPLRMTLPFRASLFGDELLLGYLVGELPASELSVHAKPIQGSSPPRWLVRIEPASERARRPVFRFEHDNPHEEV
jgi:hypothetical protein